MKNTSRTLITALFTAAVFAMSSIAFAANPAPAAAPAAKTEGAKLLNTDCLKCHAKPPADIEAKGGAHKTSVGCQDCHVGHPPAVKKPIPQCSMCHSDKPHYKLSGCLGCHKNPHTPKDIKFGNNVTDPCLTCHTQQIIKLKDNKSKHTALNCSFCHNEHGKIPKCTQCHKMAGGPGTTYHSADVTTNDCRRCHQAHMPKNVTYSNETPNKLCAGCHKKAYTLLIASKTKHAKLLCVSCHEKKHKMVPKCTDCHGTPHPAGMMARFGKCQDCHNIGHDLNNWQSAAPAAAPAKASAAPGAAPGTAPVKPAKKK
jgi:predicted CXXCH cytochrome family protein